MNINYKCKCGRTTTYGLKCVSCSGLTFDFMNNQYEEGEPDLDPDFKKENARRKKRAPKKNNKFY